MKYKSDENLENGMKTTDYNDLLKTFRNSHPYKQCSIKYKQFSRVWEYIECGKGNQTIVLLPSGIHLGEMWFPIIPALQKSFRIIAPSYPGISGMNEMIHGIYTILARERIEKTALLGMSTSGWIAQVFVREYPEVITDLILSNTSGPATIHQEKLQKAYTMAQTDVNRLVTESQQKYYLNQAKSKDTRLFLQKFLSELQTRTTKEEVLGLYRCALDFAKNKFTPEDVADWPGKVLIIETENDAGYNEEAQKDLQDLYPGAHVINLDQAGHIPVFNKPDQMITIIKKFLSV